MHVQLYSQLLRLDLSNDHLLQMYYVLYYDLPKEEQETSNIAQLIDIREKAKTELRNLITSIKDSVKNSKAGTAMLRFLPVFLKLDYLARNTFNNEDLRVCYEKEKRNIKLYYEALYNQNVPTSIVDILLTQKRKLESLP